MIANGIYRRTWQAALALAAAAGLFASAPAFAAGGEKPVKRTYAFTPPAPQNQGWEEADSKSAGCVSCHTASDQKTMHTTPAVVLGCVDCHGGDPKVFVQPGLAMSDKAYVAARDKAHVLPTYPGAWHFPSSANPKRSYTLLNREAKEFVRFVNPSDYHVVRESCGACHMQIIEAAERSLMSTGAMLWGGAGYNNGILPFKNYAFGEAYTKDGKPAKIVSPGSPHGTVTEAERKRGALAAMYPLPTWHVIPRNRPAQPGGHHPAPRGAGPPGHPPVQPGTRDRHPRRHPRSQYPQDAPQRSLHVVHGHQRPARRLSQFRLRGLPRRLCQ
jgi:hypothetical protein